MPTIQQRDMHKAWGRLNRALGKNTGKAFRSIVNDRRRMWRAVK